MIDTKDMNGKKELGKEVIIGEPGNIGTYLDGNTQKYPLTDVGEIMKYLVVLNKIRADMNISSPQDLVGKLTHVYSKKGGDKKEAPAPIHSNLQSTYDKLRNLEEQELHELYKIFGIENDKTRFEFDAHKTYDLSRREVQSAVQSTVDKLVNIGLLERVEASTYHDELSGKDIANFSLWPTKKGVDTLKSAGFYNKFEELTDAVLRTILFYKQKNMKPIKSSGEISSIMKKHQLYDSWPKEIDPVMTYLKNRGMIEKDAPNFVLTDIGKMYCDHMGINFSKNQDPKRKPVPAKRLVESPVGSNYNWPELRRRILAGFAGIVDEDGTSVKNIHNKPIRLIREDRIGGYQGGVYILLNDVLATIGYLTKDGSLVPSPELIKAAFVHKNRGNGGNLLEYIESLDNSVDNKPMTALFMNDLNGMANALDKNTYRDIKELVFNKGKVSSDGVKLLDAAKELFEKTDYHVVDKDGEVYLINQPVLSEELFGTLKQ